MKKELKVDCQRKENGKLAISMKRETNSILSPSTPRQFEYNKENLFLAELKTRNPLRNFVMSIRLDGHRENHGETILSQISLNTGDLVEFRNQIDNLLNDR